MSLNLDRERRSYFGRETILLSPQPGKEGEPFAESAVVQGRTLNIWTPQILRITSGDGRERRVQGAGDELSKFSNATLRRQREVAFSLFPDRDGGEMEQSIDNFYAAEGLTTAPALFLRKPEIPLLIEGLKEAGYSSNRLNRLGQADESGLGVSAAIYLRGLDLIVTYGPKNFQNPSQEAFFRFLLAHEKGHSTAIINTMTYRRTDQGLKFYKGRNGLGIMRSRGNGKNTGALLEEALGSYMAARYIRKRLNMPNGVWGDHESIDILDNVSMHSVYVWPTVEIDNGYIEKGSPLASGLDSLVAEYPELHDAMIASRKSGDGLLQMIKILNDIQPWLFGRLMDMPETLEGSIHGLALIQQILANKKRNY